MIIKFIKMPHSRSWFATEGGISYFHYSLRERICEKLNAMEITTYTNVYDQDQSIVITFDNDADEAAFIIQMAEGIEV
jgi:hypothetical protein